MIKSLYHLARRALRTTGRDIFRLDTLESLTKEVDSQKRQLEAYRLEVERDRSKSAVVDSLKNALDFERRYQEAYRLEKNIVPLRPERYGYVKNVNNDELLMFTAQRPEDFDWLEDCIFKFGYYEKPGVWRFTIDDDKRTLAEMIATFKPKKTLDFGCANGPVVQALVDLGINAEGGRDQYVCA